MTPVAYRPGSMEERQTMAQFGLVGSFTAQPGQRDALVALLLEAASLLETFPDCDLWFVSTAPDDPDAVWVTEVWRNQAAHAASLGDARVQEDHRPRPPAHRRLRHAHHVATDRGQGTFLTLPRCAHNIAANQRVDDRSPSNDERAALAATSPTSPGS
jgi:quinol monooxygenase YgiN